MRTVRRLRLRCLLFTTTPVVLPSVLAHHVESKYTPNETYSITCHPSRPRVEYASVEVPGVEPGSTVPSLGRIYNNTVYSPKP